jgi:hypothetical protein
MKLTYEEQKIIDSLNYALYEFLKLEQNNADDKRYFTNYIEQAKELINHRKGYRAYGSDYCMECKGLCTKKYLLV